MPCSSWCIHNVGCTEACPAGEGTEGGQPLPAEREGICLLGAEGPRSHPQGSGEEAGV